MAVNWELQLISAVLNAPDRVDAFVYVCNEAIGMRHFESMQGRTIWSHIEAFFTRPKLYGHVPSKESILETYPTLDLPTPIEELEDLVSKLRNSWVKRTIDRHLEDWDTRAGEDALGALRDLSVGISSVTETHAAIHDINWKDCAFEETIQDMEAIDTNDGITGLPYPWAIMNEKTGGIQPGDFILLWAIPKSKKTWIGLHIAVNLFMLGHRVLIYSKEMTWKNIRRRIACLIAQVGYGKYKENELTEDERQRMLDAIERTTSSEHVGELIFTDCDKADGTIGGPPEIQHKVDVYQPDFVMLDSSYMLEVPGIKDPFDWKSIAMLTKQLKQICKTTGIPMLGIMQEAERAAMKYSKSRGTASIAMFSGMVMDCDVGIKLINNKLKDETSLVFAACRETSFPGFTVHTKLCTNMDFASLAIHEFGKDEPDEDEENAHRLEAVARAAAAGPMPGADLVTREAVHGNDEVSDDTRDTEENMDDDETD